MIIKINLTEFNLEQLEELAHVINECIDCNVETEGMQMNYEAYQNIDLLISKL